MVGFKLIILHVLRVNGHCIIATVQSLAVLNSIAKKKKFPPSGSHLLLISKAIELNACVHESPVLFSIESLTSENIAVTGDDDTLWL